MLEPTPLNGGNAEYLDALYEQYLRDPASVADRWRSCFASLAAGTAERPHAPVRAAIAQRAAAARAANGAATAAPAKQAAVSRLVQDRKSVV